MESTARSRWGSIDLFECQLAASGPVSASPSPITHATKQVGIVEGGSIGVRQGITELTALVDEAGRSPAQRGSAPC